MSDSNKRRGYDKRSQDKARVATDGERPSLDTYRPRVQGLTEAFRNANLNSTSLGEVSTSPPGAAAFTGRATERSDPTPFTTPSRSNDRDGAAVYRQAHPGYVTYSGEDPRTGVKTTYQIQVSRNASGSSSRKRNKPLKHVSDRGSDPTRLRQNGFTEQPGLDDPSIVGLVFEMLLAPPPSRASALTTITALQGYVGGTRKRRFVIIQESRNDGRFSALPIITGFHNGAPRGVAKPGLIRENYSVIYTGRIAPNPTPEEAPRPLSGGGAEPGMLPNPIRVDTYAPTDALDPMSRLNYGSPHTFDRNINIRWFGRVHPDSMQHLIYQHRLVASRDAASGQQDARNTAARTISRQDPGSSNTAARRESRQDPGPNSSASPQSDAISEQELDAWLAQINATARQNNRAAVQLTPQQRAGVLASAQVRARFYQTLLQNWSRRRE